MSTTRTKISTRLCSAKPSTTTSKEQEEYQLDERAIGTWIARQYVRKSKEDAETADDGTDDDDEGEM